MITAIGKDGSHYSLSVEDDGDINEMDFLVFWKLKGPGKSYWHYVDEINPSMSFRGIESFHCDGDPCEESICHAFRLAMKGLLDGLPKSGIIKMLNAEAIREIETSQLSEYDKFDQIEAVLKGELISISGLKGRTTTDRTAQLK